MLWYGISMYLLVSLLLSIVSVWCSSFSAFAGTGVKPPVRSYSSATQSCEAHLKGLETFIGSGPELVPVFNRIVKAAPTEANIMISGETGTGKERVAQLIHLNSKRATQSFIAINCSALTETLVESTFFGHKKGAFTGASTDQPGLFDAANGGTIFLDEIGDLSLSIQAKLLRVIQERTVTPVGGTDSHKVDVRIITATHRDLREMVETKKFREDLFFRLNVVPIELPPLRERSEDILALAVYFIQRANEKHGKKVQGMTPDATAALLAYSWPGNVRQMEHAIERAVILSDFSLLSAADFEDLFPVRKQVVRKPRKPDLARVQPDISAKGNILVPQTQQHQELGFAITAWLTNKQMLALYAQKTLKEYKGNIFVAARSLGVSIFTVKDWSQKVIGSEEDSQQSARGTAPVFQFKLGATAKELQREYAKAAFRYMNGQVTKTASLLDIAPITLNKRILGIL